MNIREVVNMKAIELYTQDSANRIADMVARTEEDVYGYGNPMRWVWELLRNASETSEQKIDVQIELKGDKLRFTHNGGAFKLDEVISLIYQSTSKSSNEESRSGFGLITTTLISDSFTVNSYVNDKCINKKLKLKINRSHENKEQMCKAIKKEIEKLRDSDNGILEMNDNPKTTFTFKLDKENSVEVVNKGLENLMENIKILPFMNINSITLKVNGTVTRVEVGSIENVRTNVDIHNITVNREISKVMVLNFRSFKAIFKVKEIEIGKYGLLDDYKSYRFINKYPLVNSWSFPIPFSVVSDSWVSDITAARLDQKSDMNRILLETIRESMGKIVKTIASVTINPYKLLYFPMNSLKESNKNERLESIGFELLHEALKGLRYDTNKGRVEYINTINKCECPVIYSPLVYKAITTLQNRNDFPMIEEALNNNICKRLKYAALSDDNEYTYTMRKFLLEVTLEDQTLNYLLSAIKSNEKLLEEIKKGYFNVNGINYKYSPKIFKGIDGKFYSKAEIVSLKGNESLTDFLKSLEIGNMVDSRFDYKLFDIKQVSKTEVVDLILTGKEKLDIYSNLPVLIGSEVYECISAIRNELNVNKSDILETDDARVHEIYKIVLEKLYNTLKYNEDVKCEGSTVKYELYGNKVSIEAIIELTRGLNLLREIKLGIKDTVKVINTLTKRVESVNSLYITKDVPANLANKVKLFHSDRIILTEEQANRLAVYPLGEELGIDACFRLMANNLQRKNRLLENERIGYAVLIAKHRKDIKEDNLILQLARETIYRTDKFYKLDSYDKVLRDALVNNGDLHSLLYIFRNVPEMVGIDFETALDIIGMEVVRSGGKQNCKVNTVRALIGKDKCINDFTFDEKRLFEEFKKGINFRIVNSKKDQCDNEKEDQVIQAELAVERHRTAVRKIMDMKKESIEEQTGIEAKSIQHGYMIGNVEIIEMDSLEENSCRGDIGIFVDGEEKKFIEVKTSLVDKGQPHKLKLSGNQIMNMQNNNVPTDLAIVGFKSESEIAYLYICEKNN